MRGDLFRVLGLFSIAALGLSAVVLPELRADGLGDEWPKDRPAVNSVPTLGSGYGDWPLCELGHRVETRPPYFSATRWGPATLLGGSGCGSCGGGNSYSFNPETACNGFAVSPPHDFSINPGHIPPGGRDHPYVMAPTGETVYTETDFVLPGQGLDFTWTRTYRSAYEYNREVGYGWDYSSQLYIYEDQATGTTVTCSLGDGRVEDVYDWNSGTSSWDSPSGFNDQLTEDTRSSSHPDFPSQNYFIKTEKNGIFWEFDLLWVGPNNDFYGCTKIEDPYGNAITFEYTDTNDPLILTKVTDTVGREITFTRNGSDYITKVTVSDSAVGDYGNLEIDYEYTSDRLTKVTRHDTRQADGGTKVAPYTEYTYYTTGIEVDNLNLVKDCGTTIFNFDYETTGTDRCKKVTDADGEVHEYAHDENDTSIYWTKYTDPFDQTRDFEYTTQTDRTVKKVREHLEDKSGNDLTGTYDTTFTRNCDCGQITEAAYSDGSKEKWEYDSYGNPTKYTRESAGAEADLVKTWTYDSFVNRSRMLTTSGWLQATATPTSKVTYTWNTDGTLQKVAHPTVTTGQPSSQTIEWEYTWKTDKRVDSVTNPNGDESEWTYDDINDKVTRTDDPGSGGLARAWVTEHDALHQVTKTTDPTSASWNYTRTPDGRLLKMTGPSGEETEYEYDLRGRKTKEDKLLVDDTTDTRVETTYTVSAGGEVTQIVADSASGGIQATSDFAIDYAVANRFVDRRDPDKYEKRTKLGYGSHGLPWKIYNRDETGTPVETHVSTLERDTMGRVTASVDEQRSITTTYEYDGYGRRTKVKIDLNATEEQVTETTYLAWGGVDEVVVKKGATELRKTEYKYDEAKRNYEIWQDDVVGSLATRKTKFERDANGRVRETTSPKEYGEVTPKVSETEWDAVGRTEKTVDSNGDEVQYAYDDTNRKTTITYHEKDTSSGTFTDYVVEEHRDASGRVTSVKDKGSGLVYRTTTYSYDEGGRRTQVTSDLGWDTDWEYDNLGRMTKETREIDGSTTAATETTWSDGGLRTKVKDADNVEIHWAYDSFRRETEVKYNALGTSPAVYSKTYTNGVLSETEDPLGAEIDYTYDSYTGWLTQMDVVFGASGLKGPDRVTFAHDDMGLVTTAKTQDDNGSSYDDLTSVTREYNGFGEMKKETQAGGQVFEFTYTDNGELDEITYPTNGPVLGVRYTMDAQGRLDKVERKLSTGVEGVSTSAWEDTATFEYEGYREIQRVQANHDLDRTQSWTTWREPEILEYEKDSTNATLTGLSCYWDDDGRMVVRKRLHDTTGGNDYGEVFRYDRMDRLITMWRDVEGPQDFTSTDPTDATAAFDDRVAYNLGKLYERDDVKVKPDGGTETTIDYTNNDFYQYTDVGGDTWQWDANGQLTDNVEWAFEWTAFRQLHKATPDTGTAREHTYDAFGRRVSTKVGSQVNEYVYRGRHMVGEWDDTASEWLWEELTPPVGEGMLEHVALDTNDIDGDLDTSEYRQYAVHEDFQGTAWGTSDTSGAIVERYRYRDPYGDTYTEDSSATDIGDFASEVFHVKRLHGGVIDYANRLYDFRNRWLEPREGVWLSRDPLGIVDSESLYQFALASPLSSSDVNGTDVALNTSNCKCPCGAKDFENVRDRIRSSCDAFKRSGKYTGCYSKDLFDQLNSICGLVDGDSSSSGGEFQLCSNDEGDGGCHKCGSSTACAEQRGGPNAGLGDNCPNGSFSFCCLRSGPNGNMDPDTGGYSSKCGSCEGMVFHEFGHAACRYALGGKYCGAKENYSNEQQNKMPNHRDCMQRALGIMNLLAAGSCQNPLFGGMVSEFGECMEWYQDPDQPQHSDWKR